MGLFDLAGRYGGNPAVNASQPGMPGGRGQMPWGSGFEGMNAMSEQERMKALMMQLMQQQMMGQRNIQMPLVGGRR